MKQKRVLKVLFLLQISALSLSSNAFAETYPVIKVANAYLRSIFAQQSVSGNVTWVAPSHTESTPITGYQVRFYSTLNGNQVQYEGLQCDVDVANARCMITGTIRLNSSSQYECTDANSAFLNRLYSIKIQALSNGSLLGTQGESSLTICDVSRLESTPTPKPSPTEKPQPTLSPEPFATRSSTPTDSPGPKKTEKSTASPAQSNAGSSSPDADTNSPSSSDSKTSNSDPSKSSESSILSRFSQLGSDLDPATRKKAQAVVISYLAVAIALSTRQKG